MCGICGFLGQDKSLNFDLLIKMNQKIHRRGPDEEGFFYKIPIGMAMKRLSIIDLSHGQQPIFNEDKTICTVYNGEIYNYKELREELRLKGHHFKTESDTEVLVHLYEEYSTNMVEHLRGMFAFALWDSKEKRIILCRDRLGIKPLYYVYINNNLIFGSELKCILESDLVEKQICWQALDMFFTYSYIPAPYTIFKNIYKLEPGNMIIVENENFIKKQYWDLSFNTTADHGENYWSVVLEEKLKDAVRSHLVSDVPVGAFLSGGIDSSMVTTLMSQFLKSKVKTFTVGFSGNASSVQDERIYARLLSQKYNFDHHEFLVSPNFFEIIYDIIQAFDEPFADDSIIPSYYISKITRQNVKVALSGLGGDELFGGYERYQGFLYSKYYNFIPYFLRNKIHSVIELMPEPKSGTNRINHLKRFSEFSEFDPARRYQGFLSTLKSSERLKLYTPEIQSLINLEETEFIITRYFQSCQSEDVMNKIFYTDIKTYLPDDILTLSDRLSMWHSLELRVPLVDHHLIDLSTRIPSSLKVRLSQKKYIFKKIASRYLPKEILIHRKQGFESPMASWMKNDLKNHIIKILNSNELRKIGILNIPYLNTKFENHLKHKELNNKLIFSLLMFYHWYRIYMN